MICTKNCNLLHSQLPLQLSMKSKTNTKVIEKRRGRLRYTIEIKKTQVASVWRCAWCALCVYAAVGAGGMLFGHWFPPHIPCSSAHQISLCMLSAEDILPFDNIYLFTAS